MKSEMILHAIGKLDDKLIEDGAIRSKKKRYKPVWLGLAAAAACLCLTVGAIFPHLQPPTQFPNVPTCYDTSIYTINEVDGQCKLFYKGEPPKLDIPSNFGVSIGLMYPEFQSVEEMRQAIITGEFTEVELIALTFASDAAQGIEICDPDQLYEFNAPEELELQKIKWLGKHYHGQLTGETVRGSITCYDEEDYSESLAEGYKDFLTNPNVTITRKYKTINRLASVYYGHTDRAKFKYVCYELRAGNKKMYIQEEYLLEIQDDRLPVSSTVPDTVYFWGEENSGYFHGCFFDFTERPSLKWLKEFGLTPHKPK